jgi:hypothetical protein
MSKRLQHQTGERLFEKRGWKWALTSFGSEIRGETEEEGLKELRTKFIEEGN